MQLCKLLKIIDRPTLRARLTHRAYLEWLQLWEIDPWDEERADLRAGIIASAAVSPYAKKGQMPKPIDFMPFARRRAASKPKVAAEMRKTWEAACRAHALVSEARARRKPNNG